MHTESAVAEAKANSTTLFLTLSLSHFSLSVLAAKLIVNPSIRAHVIKRTTSKSEKTRESLLRCWPYYFCSFSFTFTYVLFFFLPFFSELFRCNNLLELPISILAVPKPVTAVRLICRLQQKSKKRRPRNSSEKADWSTFWLFGQCCNDSTYDHAVSTSVVFLWNLSVSFYNPLVN